MAIAHVSANTIGLDQEWAGEEKKKKESQMCVSISFQEPNIGPSPISIHHF